MVSETVEQVLSAEAKSDKTIADARVRAEEIIADAQKNSGELMKKKLEEAEKECTVIRNKNQERIDIAVQNTAENTKRRKSELIQQAESRMSDAADEIIKNLFV
jgi:vacuolar-type H+-ATPase subunit H